MDSAWWTLLVAFSGQTKCGTRPVLLKTGNCDAALKFRASLQMTLVDWTTTDSAMTHASHELRSIFERAVPKLQPLQHSSCLHLSSRLHSTTWEARHERNYFFLQQAKLLPNALSKVSIR